MECEAIPGKLGSALCTRIQPTVAPILPLMVMTRPMIVLPRTQAPIAIFQLRPTFIMEDAVSQKVQDRCSLSDTTYEAYRAGLTNFPVRNSPRIGHPISNIGAPVPSAL